MTGRTIEIESRSVEETDAIGRTLGPVLQSGDVVAFVGPLGSGKTHLVKGVTAGLGVRDTGIVNSPTFTLVNEYHGRLHVCHLDAYRLTDADAFLALGVDEMTDGPSVVLIEWADRVRAAIAPRALWVELAVTGKTHRRITLRDLTRPSRWASRLSSELFSGAR